MRWSIIRLIWLRELRDQLRDRRTLFMIAVLPLLLYPVLGFAVLQFALGVTERPSRIGLVRGAGGSKTFPERQPPAAGISPASATAWLSLVPPPAGGGIDRAVAAVALAAESRLILDYVPLVEDGRFTTFKLKYPQKKAALVMAQARLRPIFLENADPVQLEDKKVDLIVSAPANFYILLELGATEPVQPRLQVQWRQDDTQSQQAYVRLLPILESWKRDLKRTRLARTGLPSQFDEPFLVPPPSSQLGAAESLFGLLVRIFPFMLVMWSLAGALYPAVDLCAGEKERGTMETLLISPAGREEIVLGKFLTIWVFSAATAFLNLVSMGLTTWQFGTQIPHGGLTVAALFWCVVLILPLSAFFSAISLAVGAYARSSKEGQYYLMPLFLVTMPLIFLTLAPGVDLSPFYSLVPITGVALLMQRLMTAPSLGEVQKIWIYFIPVLAPIALYSWLALRWAIEQFKREEVLFREAERLDLRLWLRRLFHEKEDTPTTGQAMFCFGLIIGLRWFTLTLGAELPAVVHTGVSLVAFVATPALLMAVILNKRPAQTLYLRTPSWRDTGVAALLSLLLLPPLAGLALWIFNSFPDLKRLLEDRQPLLQELSRADVTSSFPAYLLVFGLLASICEELAFRGFILSGLQRRLRPRNAVILASLLFALYHMNVFQFIPAFLLGVVLGLITLRSKSVLPAMIFHFLHNGILVASPYLADPARKIKNAYPALTEFFWPTFIAACLIVGLGVLWWLYREPYVALERRERMQQEAG